VLKVENVQNKKGDCIMARIGETDAAGQVSTSSNVSSPKATETNETNENQPIGVGEKSEATKREEKIDNLVAEFNKLKKDDGNVDLKAFLSNIEDKELREAVRNKLEAQEKAQKEEKIDNLVAEFNGLSYDIKDKKELKKMKHAFLSTIKDKELRKAVENELKAQEKIQKEAEKIDKKAEKEAKKISKKMGMHTTSGKNTNFKERVKQRVDRLINLTTEQMGELFNRDKTDAPVREIQYIMATDPYPIIKNENNNNSSDERNNFEQAIQKDTEAAQQGEVNKDAPSYTGEPEKTAPENLGPQEKTAPKKKK
jgi:hypothetical protein